MFQFFEDQLNGTLGCLFLVGLFSVMFYGFTCGQVMYYLTNYCVPDEPTHITTLVVLFWVLDTGKTIIDIAFGWGPLILDHGQPLMLVEKIPVILPGEYVTSCSTIFLVQCCYLHSIWTFLGRTDRQQNRPFFMAAALLLAIGSYATGLVATAQVQSAHNIFDAFANTKLSGAIRPASAAVVDIYIATWLCYHLHDSKTGHSQSDNMVTKLVNYAFTRGMLTSVTQIIGLILFLVDYSYGTLWFLLFYIPISTIYVNSLLAMWNARRHVKWSSAAPSHPSGISTWRLNIDTALENREDRAD